MLTTLGLRCTRMLAAGILLTGCADKLATPSPEPVAASADLTASLGNGVNQQPSYYNGGNPNFGWSLLKQQSKVKTVRIEIEPGYVSQAKNWIAQAKANGYAVIATYHKSSVLGSDDATELAAAGTWWKNNYSALGGGFTVNLMNEWGSHTITPAAYAAAYNTAISSVRAVYSGPLILDIPGYGQETATAAAAVKGSSGTKITDTNIILSAHVYPNSFNQVKNHTLQTADLDDLASAGRPCLIGEFGNSPAGSADWAGLVNYAKSKGWTVLAWCWNGDGGSMNMVTPAWASNATATSFSLSAYFNQVYPLL